MSALQFHPRPAMSVRRCDFPIEGTARDPECTSCGRSGLFQVEIMGRPEGFVCAVHRKELVAAWDGALEVRELVAA